MERCSYLQAMPNSPLAPLTPLSENTQFEFNFGGDGSLDEYINGIRQEHRVEQQRKKLQEQANRTFQKKVRPPLPRRYSQEFLKLRDVFESHDGQDKQENCNQPAKVMPKPPVVKVTYTERTTPNTTRSKQTLGFDYESTPTNIRTPLKLKNNNVPQKLSAKMLNSQTQQKWQQKQIMRPKSQHLQIKQNRNFMQASPVAVKPLCSHVARILHQCGLCMYCDIFQREEIDLLAFRLLELQDLYDLGITNQNHCYILMKNILNVRQF